jgi:hypothetical protein
MARVTAARPSELQLAAVGSGQLRLVADLLDLDAAGRALLQLAGTWPAFANDAAEIGCFPAVV